MADLKTIREIAKKYTPDQIEGCIIMQLETGQNVCLMDRHHEGVINELAKAAFVKTLMAQKHLSLADALRELANKMRLAQSHSGPDSGEKPHSKKDKHEK
ncbi:MAG: hypothetical protein M0Z61_00815 [Nitrospiraceae bacterium]|nr:hypothetical protein [Nitrospiraceae bacterium]